MLFKYFLYAMKLKLLVLPPSGLLKIWRLQRIFVYVDNIYSYYS